MTMYQISAELTPAKRAEVDQKLNDIHSAMPFLLTLLASDRQSVKQLSDKHFGFLTKLLEHAAQHPELVPSYLDIAEVRKDFELVNQLLPLKQRVEQLLQQLNDTLAIAGTEANSGAFGFYNAVSQATKLNVPHAQSIYDDLRTRFPGAPTKRASSGNNGANG